MTRYSMVKNATLILGLVGCILLQGQAARAGVDESRYGADAQQPLSGQVGDGGPAQRESQMVSTDGGHGHVSHRDYARRRVAAAFDRARPHQLGDVDLAAAQQLVRECLHDASRSLAKLCALVRVVP